MGVWLSTFFSKAKIAGVLSMFLLLGSYFPYFAVSDSSISSSNKMAAGLLSPVAFALALQHMWTYQGAFLPLNSVNASDLYENNNLTNNLIMLFIDCIIYIFFAWYCDQVVPQEYGVPRPWNFIFTRDYWVETLFTAETDRAIHVTELPEQKYSDRFETVAPDIAARNCVRVCNLRREFVGELDTVHVAVNNVSFNMYEGQIFALLGHNGAGKSTLLNMLSGILPVTSGSASVVGYDLETQLSEIKKLYGTCPQHDNLFNNLTVREHMELYASLKGAAPDAIEAMVAEAIVDVQLEVEEHQEAGSLSGGQKRRLCLALALIADSKVVFLDECTSGVDPFSRRAIWDMLVKKKKGRIIVLTTHFIEEADYLGDRIAIMHHGVIKCCGSPLFLKSRYGVGYNMTFTIPHPNLADNITAIVKSLITSADLLSCVGTELSLRLPLDQSSLFPTLLSTLDDQKSSLGFTNYGLSVTTLEEVFLRVAKESGSEDAAAAAINENPSARDVKENQSNYNKSKTEVINDLSFSSKPEFQTFSRHVTALLVKRYNVAKRDMKGIFCTLVLPIFLLTIGLALLLQLEAGVFDTLELNSMGLNKPLYYPVNCGPVNAPSNCPVQAQFPSNIVTESFSNASLVDFSYQILNRSHDHLESRYGAFMSTKTPIRANSDGTDNTLSDNDIYFGIPINPNASYTYSFNNMSAVHGIPIFQNLISNLILKNLTNSLSSSITTFITPFALTALQQQTFAQVTGISSAIIIAMAFCFVPSTYIVFVVRERELKSKHLQIISGVQIIPYWLSNYIFDFICFFIVSVIMALIIYAYGNTAFTGENFQVVILIFIMFGLAVIPFTYICSFLFDSHSTAQNVIIMIYLVSGVFLVLLTFILNLFPSTQSINDNYLRHIFRLLPNYCMSDTIFRLSFLTGTTTSRWDNNISGYNFAYLLWEIPVYSALTILIEWCLMNREFLSLYAGDYVSLPPPVPTEIARMVEERDTERDSDVDAEKERIKSGKAEGELVTLSGLRKIYHGSGKIAVRDLYFSIPKNECFGFLGVNGAGKSTTLKILTGDELPLGGYAKLGGYNIAENPEKVRQLMGYCPQFDALHDLMTAEEHLEFYARIRGVPEDKVSELVQYLIKRLTLDQDNQHTRPAGTYSGGNKRKLSVAIALIGNPPIVFLDEPSTGMDPVSRRFMWDFISSTMEDRAVILTTHSMEECEALCQRIGILVLGSLKCLGSAQHLKSKFGSGYQIDMSLEEARFIPGIRDFIKRNFISEEIECFGSNIKFRIQPTDDKGFLAKTFTLIEENKPQLGIRDYSVGQTALEQIFLQFARGGDNMLRTIEMELNPQHQASEHRISFSPVASNQNTGTPMSY